MSGKVNRFEDLIAWQKGRALTAGGYKVTAEGPFAKDYGLRDQIGRAAVSVMSNVAEGFERGTTNEFFHFLSIAKGSCAEVRSQLYVALDVGYLPRAEFTRLLADSEEVGRVVGGLRASVGRKREGR